jgi:hypothetical protein
VIGSEMSGDVRNVYMHDCEFEGTDRAVRIKAKRGRGGVVENVWAENIRVKDLRYEVVILNMDYSSDQQQLTNQRAPLFRNITVRNVTGEGAPAAVRIVGLPDSPIENVRFENFIVASTRGVIASHVRDLFFDGVLVTPRQGPVFELSDARDVRIRGGKAPAGTDVFLTLAGQNSGGVVLESGDFAAAKQVFTTATDVPAGAVTVR